LFIRAAATFKAFLVLFAPVFRIRNWICIRSAFYWCLDLDPDPYLEYGSGSRRGNKSKNEGENKAKNRYCPKKYVKQLNQQQIFGFYFDLKVNVM
jgi:hypothetical protein